MKNSLNSVSTCLKVVDTRRFDNQATTANIEGKSFAHFRGTQQSGTYLGSVIPGMYGVAVGGCSRNYAFWPRRSDGCQHHKKNAYEKSSAHDIASSAEALPIEHYRF